MNSSLFNNDELNELFLNGKVKEVKKKIDESLSEMGGEYEESLHFDLIQDAYTLSAYLKEQNSSYLENLTSVVDQIEKNKLDGINDSSDYEKVKNRSEQLNESNENNMKYFIENYFYVILKLLLVVLVIYLLFTMTNISLFSINIGAAFGSLYNKISDIPKNVQNGVEILKTNIKKPEDPILKTETKKTNKVVKSFNNNNNANNNSGNTTGDLVNTNKIVFENEGSRTNNNNETNETSRGN